MMRKIKIALGLAAVACAGVLFSLRTTAAEKTAVNVSAQQSVADVLRMAAANALRINMSLKGGAQYSAKVKDVGAGAAVLTEPAEKEFYDVYVPIDAIASIEIRVRDR